MANEDKIETHEKAVDYASRNLIEHGVMTRYGTTPGIDLILDNGKTVLVRGLNKETVVPLTHDRGGDIKSDYVMIITNLRYAYLRNVYILNAYDAKMKADNRQIRKNGMDNWFIKVSGYRGYQDNYDIL